MLGNKQVARNDKATGNNGVEDVVTAVLTASRALVGVSARSLAGVEDRVTLPQFRVLVVLDRSDERLNLNGLAEILSVNSSTAMRMVDRLLVAGLATRQDKPGNRREVLLGLTPAGRRLVRRVTAKRREEITRIVEAMPATHRSRLVEALRAFADAAGEPTASGETQEAGW